MPRTWTARIFDVARRFSRAVRSAPGGRGVLDTLMDAAQPAHRADPYPRRPARNRTPDKRDQPERRGEPIGFKCRAPARRECTDSATFAYDEVGSRADNDALIEEGNRLTRFGR